MTFTLKGSHIVAIVITVLIGVYMFFGDLEIGGQSAEDTQAPSIAERKTDNKKDLFRVSYVKLVPETRVETVSMRGRTQADSIIPVKAQTGGILQKRLVTRGDVVEEGQLVCVLERGAREATLASAQASLVQADAEYNANKSLNKKGFATDTRMRQMTAALNAAKAQLQQAELELSYTEVKANAAGIVQDPIASPGDVLSPGSTCITLVDRDPMFFIGQLSESDISNIQTGMKAQVSLVTGLETSGEITYIAPSADPQTRTFRVEIRLDTTSESVRDGLTSTAKIAMAETQAFRVSPSWLTLADSGELGVKVLNANDEVQFKNIEIVSQGNNGFWIEGLESGTRIITLGQEYVISGEKVQPVMQEAAVTENAQ